MRITVIDTETTGLDLSRHEIIQIGDLYIEASSIAVADAWVSTDKIIWIGYTPYLFLS